MNTDEHRYIHYEFMFYLQPQIPNLQSLIFNLSVSSVVKSNLKS